MPVDWVADALLLLLFKPALRHRRYHVPAGETRSVTWAEVARVFARCYGERPDDPIPGRGRGDDPARAGAGRAVLGPGAADRLLAALPLYYRFMEMNAEIFDNTRLLDEGMPPAPRLTSYLERCATHPADRSVYDQMLDDV